MEAEAEAERKRLEEEAEAERRRQEEEAERKRLEEEVERKRLEEEAEAERLQAAREALVSAGPDYQDPLVMINARLFRALVDAPSNIGHSCFPRLLAALPLASHRRCGRSRRSPAHRCGALALPRPMAARRRSPAAASLLPF